MSENLLFYYFGEDEACFRALQVEFKRHAKIPITFARFNEENPDDIETLFLKVYTDKPNCVFIDFSKNIHDQLHLARLLIRTPLENKVIIVGLVDYLSPPEVSREIISTGAHLNFIKGSDPYDIAFHVTKLVSPQSIGELGFATATLSEDFDCGIVCKIGYIDPDGIHIETDYPLAKGSRVVFNHHWANKNIVPSRQAFVKEVTSKNLFYHFKFNADLDFLFVDDFLPPEGMPEEERKQKNGTREEEVVFHKKTLLKWIEENANGSLEKRAKLLVVDSTFHIYKDLVRTDKLPYTIRCIPFFDNVDSELDRLRPQIIAFEMDNGENQRNTLDSLKKLVSALMARFPDLKPFIIVFNTELSSKDIQGAIQYNQALAHTAELSSNLLIKLATMLQNKMTSEAGNEIQSDAQKIFLRKNDPAAIGELMYSVKIIKLSESDLILQTDYPLPSGSNLHFTSPVEMFVNVMPSAKPSGKVPEFNGLIHSISEASKKDLRRFINSVFFREHDAQVSAEALEFKKLNDQKLQERIDAEKKAKEEAEAKEAEKLKAKEEIEKAKADKAKAAEEKAKSPEVS
jgi:hypothetical protein